MGQDGPEGRIGEHDGAIEIDQADTHGHVLDRGLEARPLRREFEEQGARLILSAAPAQCRARQAHEDRRMKRALEEGDVAEDAGETCRGRIALEPTAALGQQHEGEVRPRRLAGNPVRQVLEVGGLERLLGNDREPGAAADFVHERINVPTYVGGDAGLLEERARNCGVAAARRQDQRPFRAGLAAAGQEWSSSMKGPSFPM